jgi:hypothetical protein
MGQSSFDALTSLSIYQRNVLIARVIIHAYNHHVRVLSPEPLVIDKPNSTRAEERSFRSDQDCISMQELASSPDGKSLAFVTNPASDRCSLHDFPSSIVAGLPPRLAHFVSSDLECFLARAKPPRRAQARLSSFVVFKALASPPSLPRRTACGLFCAINLSYLALSKK